MFKLRASLTISHLSIIFFSDIYSCSRRDIPDATDYFVQQTDVTLFQDFLGQFPERLPTLSPEFCQYFQHEWLGREESWAYSYRTGMGINTNMMVEAFHRVFKYNYLKEKYNKRVDNCLVNLMKYTRDKLFERLIKLTKGKSTSKLKLIQDRHNRSKVLSFDNVQSIDDSKWLVKSETGSDTYTVSKMQHTCTDATCQLSNAHNVAFQYAYINMYAPVQIALSITQFANTYT